MYKKFLIVASKLDKAGIAITTQLSQFGEYDFHLVDNEALYEEHLNQERINDYDFIIFASRHASEKKEKTLSIHAPGNWRSADFGGKPEQVSPTSAQFQKQMFQILEKNVVEHKLEKYSVTLECTHHGPLIEKPCLFIEIGSTEVEWGDRHAAFVIAKTIDEAIKTFKENPYNEIAFAIGGPHYCPEFNKFQSKSNVAISHVIPKYMLPLTETMVEEAVNKTEEEIDFALVDWKGIGDKKSRDQVKEVLDRLYIRCEKLSEVSRRTDFNN